MGVHAHMDTRAPGTAAARAVALALLLTPGWAPGSACGIVQPIFRSPVDVSNFYLARPRARALLGRPWLEAGEPDSALHHLRRVDEAWSRADPAFDDDRARVRGWIERAMAEGSS